MPKRLRMRTTGRISTHHASRRMVLPKALTRRSTSGRSAAWRFTEDPAMGAPHVRNRVVAKRLFANWKLKVPGSSPAEHSQAVLMQTESARISSSGARSSYDLTVVPPQAKRFCGRGISGHNQDYSGVNLAE